MISTLDALDVEGKVVLLRADFNVPLQSENGTVRITDDARIVAALPTIRELRARGARIVILAHLGRPKGQVVEALSLQPIAGRLGELLDSQVELIASTSLDQRKMHIARMVAGDVVLLENVRFDPRETSKDEQERQELARSWAVLGDAFVSEGFGVLHRHQASVTELPRLLPGAAGRLVEKELHSFDRVLTNPQRPYVVVLGGSKVSDKLGVIENLIATVDQILIGGGMAFTFLAARGLSVGRSLLEESMLPTVARISAEADRLGVQITLPTDVVVASEISAAANTAIVDVDSIPADMMGLDIGPATAQHFAQVIAGAHTVVWNGPMGVFEVPPFAAGTKAVAQAMSESEAFTVVGGGDSAAAIHLLDIDAATLSHISTGGGASLELLEGRTLPGLAALEPDTPEEVIA